MTPTVLVVDPSPATTRQLADSFAAEGWCVQACVQDGLEGIDLALRLGVDLVTVDLLLPRCSGLQVVERVRASAPRTAFVVVTAVTARPSVEAARAAGVSSYVVKPLSLPRVADVARRLLPGASVRAAG